MTIRNFKITGVDVHGRRFPAIHTKSAMLAFGINLYRGNVWESIGGKWRIVKSVWN